MLSLVDLAGSERLKESGSTGKRLKETQNINKVGCSVFSGVSYQCLLLRDVILPYSLAILLIVWLLCAIICSLCRVWAMLLHLWRTRTRTCRIATANLRISCRRFVWWWRTEYWQTYLTCSFFVALSPLLHGLCLAVNVAVPRWQQQNPHVCECLSASSGCKRNAEVLNRTTHNHMLSVLIPCASPLCSSLRFATKVNACEIGVARKGGRVNLKD